MWDLVESAVPRPVAVGLAVGTAVLGLLARGVYIWRRRG